MDDAVLRAMAKWPHVPAVFGWLTLDRRGRWLLRGTPVTNEGARRFIARNYGVDDEGRAFFQNGPQRVYVDLECTPWVLRLAGGDGPVVRLETHTGAPVEAPRGAWIDEDGHLFLEFERGVGLVEERDLPALAERLRTPDGAPADEEDIAAALQAGPGAPPGTGLVLDLGTVTLPLRSIRAAELPRRFRFHPRPRGNSGVGPAEIVEN